MSLLGSISSINPLGGLNKTSDMASALQEGVGAMIPGGLGKTQELAGLTQAGALDGVSTGALAGAGSVQGSDSSSAFVNFLDNAVQEVNGKMNAADVQEAKMMTGDSSNLHQTVISMQEANIALSLMVNVRNKLVESYQELMRMQV